MSPTIRRWSFQLTALFMPLLIMGCHDDGSSSTGDILDIISAAIDLALSIVRVST